MLLFSPFEIRETTQMITEQNLDIRTITLGLNLLDCVAGSPAQARVKVYDKVTRAAEHLLEVGEAIEVEYGIPIINRRISVTPVSLLVEATGEQEPMEFALTLDRAAQAVGVDFLGGYSALVHKGMTPGELRLIESIPEALAGTEKVCASVNVATSHAGINMDAVAMMGEVIHRLAEATADSGGFGNAKLVVFSNVPGDNPFMAGAFHGIGEGERVVHVGVSGPGAVYSAVREHPDATFDELAEIVKKTAFKITRMGQLVLGVAAERLGVEPGIVDLSLAPTPAVGDSVARILEAMGLEHTGAPGSTAALALLNNAVKKGGMMASSRVGGLSGSFLPVSEDEGMAEAAEVGALSIEKLEAMTAICSVGLDMIAIPGDTSPATISGIIADEMAIGVMNGKTTATRLIPVPGKKAGEWVEFGGLLGRAPVMPVSRFSCDGFVRRGGLIPAPITSFRN
ncbi:MAG: PFL family protein [Alkalispirochaetaceae bacterium]